MGLRIIDKKFASAIAIAGAVSLVSVPAWAAGERQGAAKQPGAAQYQMERQPGQEMHQQLSSEQIREAQEKLRDEGHNPGPIDGIWGAKTQAAVKEFQKEKDLQVTGQLDQQTLSELGVDNNRGLGLMDRQRGEVRRDAPGAPEAPQQELGQQQQQRMTGEAQQPQAPAAGYGAEQRDQQLGQQDRSTTEGKVAEAERQKAGERRDLPPGAQPGNMGERTPGEAQQQQDPAGSYGTQQRDQQQLGQQGAIGERAPAETQQRLDQGEVPPEARPSATAQHDQQQARQQDRGLGQQQMGMETHQQLSSDQIRQIQEKLKEEGHNPGPIDGTWGPQTQAAVREFQQQKNLQVTGDLDQQTMQELGVTLEPKPHIGESIPPGAEFGTDRGAAGERSEQQPGQQQVQ